MGVSNLGVSDIVNTTDGRAVGVTALNSGNNDHIGGLGVVNRLGSQPTGTQAIIAQNGNYLITEASDRITTQG
jgi:hypothetical protein